MSWLRECFAIDGGSIKGFQGYAGWALVDMFQIAQIPRFGSGP